MAALEIFADISCPFAYVGLLRAKRRRDELSPTREPLWIRAWPLELVNGAPQDPATVLSHIAELREQIEPELFAGFDPSSFPSSTLPALSIASQGYQVSDSVGEAASFALRHALFEKGEDLSCPDALVDIGLRVGVVAPDPDDHALVIEDWHEGRKRGVEGSPQFFCKGLTSFCPALDISRDDEGRMHLRPNSNRLDRFLLACFRAETAAAG